MLKKKTYHIEEGETATLTCRGLSVVSVWQKVEADGTKTIYASCSEVKQDLDVSPRLSLSGNCQLVIRNFTFSDEGVYRCSGLRNTFDYVDLKAILWSRY